MYKLSTICNLEPSLNWIYVHTYVCIRVYKSHFKMIKGCRITQNRVKSSVFGVFAVQWKSIEPNFKGPTKSVLIIRNSSYQDMLIHVQYYSKPNRAWKLPSLC